MSTTLTPSQLLEIRRLRTILAANGNIFANPANQPNQLVPMGPAPANYGSVLYFNTQGGYNASVGSLFAQPSPQPETTISYSGNASSSILMGTFTTPTGLIQASLIEASVWMMNVYGISNNSSSVSYYFSVYYVSADGTNEVPVALGVPANATPIRTTLDLYTHSLSVPRLLLPDLTYSIRIKVYVSFASDNNTVVLDFSGRTPSFINTSLIINRDCTMYPNNQIVPAGGYWPHYPPPPCPCPCPPVPPPTLVNASALTASTIVGANIISTIITQSIIPAIDNAFDIGAPGLQFRSFYVGANTINIGGVPLSANPSGELEYKNSLTRSTIKIGGDKYNTRATETTLAFDVAGNLLTQQSIFVGTGLAYAKGVSVLITDTQTPFATLEGSVVLYNPENGFLVVKGVKCLSGPCVNSPRTYTCNLIGLTGEAGATGAAGPTGPVGSSYITFTTLPSSLTPRLGDLITLQVGTGLSYTVGISLLVADTATPFSSFQGVVRSYSPINGQLILENITTITGPFTNISTYRINLTGPSGAVGAVGATGPGGAVGATGAAGVGSTGPAGDRFKTSTQYPVTLSPVVGSTIPLTVGTNLAYITGNTVLVVDQNAPYGSFQGTILTYDQTTGYLNIGGIVNIKGTFPNISIFNVTINGLTGGFELNQTILPTQSNAFDIGSLTFPLRSLYVGGNSLHVGRTILSEDSVTGYLSYSNYATGNNFIINGSGGGGGGTVGPIGPTGPSGGPVGPTGPAGLNGTNGVNGINGTNGTNGTNGLIGPTGPSGGGGGGLTLAGTVQLTYASGTTNLSGATFTPSGAYTGTIDFNNTSYGGNNYFRIFGTNIGMPTSIIYRVNKVNSTFGVNVTATVVTISFPSASGCLIGYNGDNSGTIYGGSVNGINLGLSSTDTGLAAPHASILIYK